jgi:hypothetical protein
MFIVDAVRVRRTRIVQLFVFLVDFIGMIVSQFAVDEALLVQVAQLHATNVFGEHGDKEDHLHEEVDQQTDIGKHAKLLNGWHHGQYAKEDYNQLKCENLGDQPALFFQTERNAIAHVQVERCGHDRFGQE